MENFSTPSRASMLPRLANGATLAVLVTATWLSAQQRPVAPVISQPAVPATTSPTLTSAHLPAGTGTGTVTQAQWSGKAAVIGRDGLQPVGYQPAVQPR